jgi:hypothetical protein
MKKKFKIYIWDIGSNNIDFNGYNYILYWQGNSFIIMLWKLYKAKNKNKNTIKLVWY